MILMEIKLGNLMRKCFRLLIEDEFKLNLFEKAITKMGTAQNLAKTLSCSRDSVRDMKTGQTRFVKWPIVKKLIELAEISEEELEQHVLAIKGGKSGKETKVKLPIKSSPELALLVAKGMGDGSIERKNFRFSYWNKDDALIKEVVVCVEKAIGQTRATINKLEDGRMQAKFNTFVGFVLHTAGVPTGNKTLQAFNIPDWIKNGSEETRAYFIRGLFDDEGCVHINAKHRTRNIIFAQGKVMHLRHSLVKFFTSIKQILLEFGIRTSNVTEQKFYKDKNEREKIILRFSICGKENLENYRNKIGFTHPQKNMILKNAIESYVNIHKSKESILKIIQNATEPRSTTEISKLAHINRKLAFLHLNELSKNGKVFRSCGTSPIFWFRTVPSVISNREKVLKTLNDSGPLTAREISDMASIDDGCVFNIIEKLSDEGLIIRSGKVSPSKRPSNLWSPNRNKI